jgi:antitoxin VapB
MRGLQPLEILSGLMYIQMGYTEIAMPTTTSIFKSNQTQAVRLPKDVAFPEGVHEVEIVKVGNSRIISPVGHRWDSFFADPVKVSEDFLKERDQGTFEEREPL